MGGDRYRGRWIRDLSYLLTVEYIETDFGVVKEWKFDNYIQKRLDFFHKFASVQNILELIMNWIVESLGKYMQ